MRSTSSSRAVRNRTGTELRARIWRQTSKPSRAPGRPTSRMTIQGSLVVESLEALLAVGGQEDAVALAPEVQVDQVGDVRVVLDDDHGPVGVAVRRARWGGGGGAALAPVPVPVPGVPGLTPSSLAPPTGVLASSGIPYRTITFEEHSLTLRPDDGLVSGALGAPLEKRSRHGTRVAGGQVAERSPQVRSRLVRVGAVAVASGVGLGLAAGSGRRGRRRRRRRRERGHRELGHAGDAVGDPGEGVGRHHPAGERARMRRSPR